MAILAPANPLGLSWIHSASAFDASAIGARTSIKSEGPSDIHDELRTHSAFEQADATVVRSDMSLRLDSGHLEVAIVSATETRIALARWGVRLRFASRQTGAGLGICRRCVDEECLQFAASYIAYLVTLSLLDEQQGSGL